MVKKYIQIYKGPMEDKTVITTIIPGTLSYKDRKKALQGEECVTNKVIEVTQCTISWYVDDNKISYKNLEMI